TRSRVCVHNRGWSCDSAGVARAAYRGDVAQSSEVQVMSSDLGRGIKLGIGFALGVGFVMTLFPFGLSMCAGQLHRRMMEQMEEMLPKERRPVPETQGDR